MGDANERDTHWASVAARHDLGNNLLAHCKWAMASYRAELEAKHAPAALLQELLAEMRSDSASGNEVGLSYYADKLEAALGAEGKKGSVK